MSKPDNYMAKKNNIVAIDLDVWTTMAKKAAELKLSESTIRQRVHRAKAGKSISEEKKEDTLEIPELDLVLVKKP
jgi:hypothetical protein